MVWTRLTGEEEQELWARRRAGERLSSIARALGRRCGVIHAKVKASGGITPRQRRRSEHALTLAEREEISRGLSADRSVRQIARRLGRAASSISREIRRHGGRGRYRALQADRQAWESARRPKRCLLAERPQLALLVSQKLQRNWSPRQIAGWLPTAFPDDHSMRVSHETIYRSLFIQSRGALKKELLRHLRMRRTMRQNKNQERTRMPGPISAGALSIRERPAEATDRAVPGHWEGDLLAGSGNSHIVTLVERHSRFVMLIKLENRDSATVVEALSRTIQRLPRELRRSLTWDRGTEMARHKEFTIATDVHVYFCDPHSPWQRGSNENTNGLLRQYFPKGTDLSVHSQAYLDAVAFELNQRPRETLGFRTPADKLSDSVASTA